MLTIYTVKKDYNLTTTCSIYPLVSSGLNWVLIIAIIQVKGSIITLCYIDLVGSHTKENEFLATDESLCHLFIQTALYL